MIKQDYYKFRDLLRNRGCVVSYWEIAGELITPV